MRSERINEPFENEYKKYLYHEIGRASLSSDVVETFENTYKQLGEQETPNLPKKNTPLKVVFSTAGAVAACFVLLLTVNFINPAFAEGLPLIGNTFKSINSLSKSSVGTNLDTYETEPVNEVLLAIAPTECEVELLNVFSDGEYAHASFEMRVPDDVAEKYYYFYTQGNTAADGVACESALFSDNGQSFFWPTGEPNTFAGTLAYKLPKKYENGESFKFSITIEKFMGVFREGNGDSEDAPIPQFSAETELTADTSNNKSFDINAKSNDYELFHIESTPSYTIVTSTYSEPIDAGEKYGGASNPQYPVEALFTGDGKELKRNYSFFEGEDWVEPAQTGASPYAFDGVPAGANMVVFRWYRNYDYDEVLAEFTIDLINQTAKASETYKEEKSPLYLYNPTKYSAANWSSYNSEDEISDRLYQGMTDEEIEALYEMKDDMSDEDMEAYFANIRKYAEKRAEIIRESVDFQNGMGLQSLSIVNRDTESWIDLNIWADEYRDIEVQVYCKDILVAKEESIDGWEYTRYALQTGYFDERFEYFEEQGKQSYYSFRIDIPNNIITSNDTSLTVKAVDPKTGEILMETTADNIEYAWGVQ